MATKSTKRTGSKKAQKPRMEVRDLKARKDLKGGQKMDFVIKGSSGG
jgi:hypothetical protein